MARRAFALPPVAADQPPFSWARSRDHALWQAPIKLQVPLTSRVSMLIHCSSSVLAAAHCSSGRAPLAGLAPHSRILQRAVLCYAVLCCAVPLISVPRGVVSRPRLPLWSIHFPLIAPWATIISAGPERTINPPLAPAKRLVPIFHEVGARQPARRQERQNDFISRSTFFPLSFCVGAAALTASNPSLFFSPSRRCCSL
ncbi:hypothetical protein M441DRAFT_343250 [Trichoderma asperellum CBS 433.97]|uniref:Uncharacterized protein n=1 Tax=Trichoderma asperellum (strain ATCC 204424 / CBS 433.97 / NBRC 101777) TaxID=1042311 RepID=A0A2T3ZHA9_TRIA4|nr:hypothetical protein M441DRAFT_343250 [Trichoderma asperellum CBS 433.97]PTB44188.1 hypothetical protein M441DRAFT_343250 [Trichoderma asperellum CBS 433.97]